MRTFSRRPAACLRSSAAAPPASPHAFTGVLAAVLLLVAPLAVRSTPAPAAGAADAAFEEAASGAAPQPLKAPPPPAGFSIDGGSAERGAAIFAKRCALCHGENGDGNGRIKAKPDPRDLRNGEYMATRSDWELYLVIRDGGPAVGMSKTMLPWKSLSDQDLDDLVVFIRGLAEEAP